MSHDLLSLYHGLCGSLQLQVSFAEYRLFYRALLQKRPRICSASPTGRVLTRFVTVCCSKYMLQGVAASVCCSVLQQVYVAVCCSTCMLQCVAASVCCSVLRQCMCHNLRRLSRRRGLHTHTHTHTHTMLHTMLRVTHNVAYTRLRHI